MRSVALRLLRLYPRPWRDRYEAEVRSLLRERRVRAYDLLDLLRGALDAQLHPQLAPRLQLAMFAAEPAVSVPPLAPAYGRVAGPPARLLSRRAFMHRMLGIGVGILSLQFLGGTVAFLWPNITQGLGAEFRVGTLADIVARSPEWARGWPLRFQAANSFLVNVVAARALALGDETVVGQPAADQILALWRKCPHLGCQVPDLCDTRKRFECLCHGSTYNILGEKLEKGPAERGMDRFGVRIGDDGVLVIDTGELISGAPEGTLTFRDPHPADVGCG
jgi:Rieske Fe-S protein